MLTVSESRDRILRRAYAELGTGTVVNLGVGLPTALTKFIDYDRGIYIHSENGILGVGPSPRSAADSDPALINASKQPVTLMPGGSFFDSATSFAMIRGGHIDLAVIGALQISQVGLLANWLVPGENVLGVGGAMDLVAGAKSVLVVTTHCTKSGAPKIVKECTYPITATRPVDTIITERALFRRTGNVLQLAELGQGFTLESIYESTDAEFEVAEHISVFA